ncbi:MAG: hypothetical protein NZ903_02585 [Candidatus Micrarchaeota archaeon]|nr:hypothetical protein [Candidatus Micrarchaeota archaeon]
MRSKSNSHKQVFIFRRKAKFIRLKPTREDIRKALIKNGVGFKTTYDEFIKMKFDIKGASISAQTLLRSFGDGSRSSKNIAMLLSWAGINSYFVTKTIDYSDPAIIKAILLKSKIDLQKITFDEFLEKKIKNDLFIGSGKSLIRRFQRDLLKRINSLPQNEREKMPGFLLKLAQMKTIKKHISFPLLNSFLALLKLAGKTNSNYPSLKDNPVLLRKILSKGGIDFDNWKVSITEFFRARFDSSELHEIDLRNHGTMTGQAIAKRYFGTNAVRNHHIYEMLRSAGFKPRL